MDKPPENAPENGQRNAREAARRATRYAVFAELDRVQIEAGRIERERLRAILECDRHDLWKGQGARDHAEFLSGRYGMSKFRARRMIAAAYTLEYLPLTSHALETGTLPIDKVVELTRFATPAEEKKLISWARHVTPSCIRARADEATRKTLKQVQTEQEESMLGWWSHELGLEIEGRLTHEAGAAFTAAIDKLANALPDLPIGDEMRVNPARSMEQRRAEALVALITQGAGGAGSRPTVVVHAPLEAMTTATKNARTEEGQPLHPTTAQRLACDGHIDVVLYDRERVVDMGRSSREPSPQLRRQVLKRDSNMCTFPGCGQKRFLQIHHTRPWTAGGQTDLDNLITTCSIHHKLVHEQGWGVEFRGGDVPQWYTPSGRVFDPGPAPPGNAPPEPEPNTDPRPWGSLWHWLESVEGGRWGNPETKHLLKMGARFLMTAREKDRGRMTLCEMPSSSTRSEPRWGDSAEPSHPSDPTTLLRRSSALS